VPSRPRWIPGAVPVRGGVLFRVWAPRASTLWLELDGRLFPLRRLRGGRFEGLVAGVGPGATYWYVFEDGERRPDPTSRCQWMGVCGSSMIVDLSFPWTDAGWRGVEAERLVFYELHVGTFTPEGTFDAVIPRLAELAQLGVTALQLMPVAAWDGAHGWGYDGASLYAPHEFYGTPRSLQRLVDACHRHHLAVFLDVVYNHLGPSGNFLSDFGPSFTSRHHTPWGKAFDFDGPGARPVRDFVIENALSWIRDYHFDGLRLDSVRHVADGSPRHVLAELGGKVRTLASRLGRRVHLVAEGGLGRPQVVHPPARGGWGLAAQWADDFHHALHTLLTHETEGYYRRFGRLRQLAAIYRRGGLSRAPPGPRMIRTRNDSRSAGGLRGRHFVVAAQNHDQVGNRPRGDRLAASLPPEALRLAAAATILSPFVPLLFMGEEYAEFAPFEYFTSFPDEPLGRDVFRGRLRELRDFGWKGRPDDPQDPSTFRRSKLRWERSLRGRGARMRKYVQALLTARREVPALADDALHAVTTAVDSKERTLVVRRSHRQGDALLVLRFSSEPGPIALPAGRWRVHVDGWDRSFAATGRWQLEKLHEGATRRRLDLGPFHSLLLLGDQRR
jgi:maltooligosyltrehalose trehalohydrolase